MFWTYKIQTFSLTGCNFFKDISPFANIFSQLKQKFSYLNRENSLSHNNSNLDNTSNTTAPDQILLPPQFHWWDIHTKMITHFVLHRWTTHIKIISPLYTTSLSPNFHRISWLLISYHPTSYIKAIPDLSALLSHYIDDHQLLMFNSVAPTHHPIYRPNPSPLSEVCAVLVLLCLPSLNP